MFKSKNFFFSETREETIKKDPVVNVSNEDPLQVSSRYMRFTAHALDQVYEDFPLPEDIRHIAVHTVMWGGLGDLMAAAKVIRLVHQKFPEIAITWQLMHCTVTNDWLNDDWLKRLFNFQVTIYKNPSVEDVEKLKCDFVIVGPTYQCNNQFVESRGNILFTEIDDEPTYWRRSSAPMIGGYDTINHLTFFPLYSRFGQGILRMGLFPNGGLLFDKALPEVYQDKEPLSWKFLLEKIKSRELVCSLSMLGEKASFSLNVGYANNKHGDIFRFILAVAHFEQENENIVIIVNDTGHCKSMFSDIVSTHRSFLEKLGYGKIVFGPPQQDDSLSFEIQKSKKSLMVIFQSWFYPEDLSILQMQAQCVLATGDQSAGEAWNRLPPAFFYETLNHKRAFLKDQIKIARGISPDAADLLEKFASLGENKDGTEWLEEFTPDKVARIKGSSGTQAVALCIIKEYSFNRIFMSAFQRAIWHQIRPQLSEVERESLSSQTRELLLSVPNNPENARQAHEQLLQNLPAIHTAIEVYIAGVMTLGGSVENFSCN